MGVDDFDRLERLQSFVRDVTNGMGRLERGRALGLYLTALLLPGERKSLEPLALRVAPNAGLREAYRQRMQQAVAVAEWSELTLYERLSERFRAAVADIDAVVIDDTGFPKKGRHSVGVQRQYSGSLGRVDNCQVAVSLHLAAPTSGCCIGMRLFLPESWEDDATRLKKCQVPDDVAHKSKCQLALDMLAERAAWDLKPYVVLADAGYGDSSQFRNDLAAQGFNYVVGVKAATSVFTPDRLPLGPEPRREGQVRGRPRTAWGREPKPQSVLEIAHGLPASSWSHYEWSNGANPTRCGQFAAVRVHCAHRATRGAPPGEEQWLLIQWDNGDEQPSRFWFSNLPSQTTTGRLVYLAKLRWRIERDYQEMKEELGLDHYEGRGWVGFHHHCALVAAAHAFLALERALSPPQPTNATAVSPTLAERSTLGDWALPVVQTLVLPPRRRKSAS
jgi:SRSO17 transposase